VAALAVGPAEARSTSLRVGAPARGEASVLLASVHLRTGQRPPRLAVKASPADAAVLGGVTPRGAVAVAVVRPSAGAMHAASTVVRLRVRIRGARVAGGVLGKPGRRAAACADAGLAAALGRELAPGADIDGDDARALGALLARRACGGELSAADAELLSRLGLNAAKGPAGGASVGTLPAPAAAGAAAGGGAAKPAGPQCSNGIDDDGDGQVDHLQSGNKRPDPGCADANDDSEGSEVPVDPACGKSSGVSQSPDDHTSLFLGINSGCGSFTRVWVNVAPSVAKCQALTSDSTFDCAPSGGNAVASARDGKPVELVDIPLSLTGAADCSVPATVALTRPDGTVAELVEPIGPCAGGGAQCGNGRDDDGDGQVDARQLSSATDPDPGCTDASDDSEGSEVDLPAGCTVSAGLIDGNPQFPGVVTNNGCGELVGMWFKPSAAPTGCAFRVGSGTAQQCAVTGAVGEASFAPSTAGVLLGVATATRPACGPVTVALLRRDGSVAEGRGNWC
jgi:hypothetical protein